MTRDHLWEVCDARVASELHLRVSSHPGFRFHESFLSVLTSLSSPLRSQDSCFPKLTYDVSSAQTFAMISLQKYKVLLLSNIPYNTYLSMKGGFNDYIMTDEVNTSEGDN